MLSFVGFVTFDYCSSCLVSLYTLDEDIRDIIFKEKGIEYTKDKKHSMAEEENRACTLWYKSHCG